MAKANLSNVITLEHCKQAYQLLYFSLYGVKAGQQEDRAEEQMDVEEEVESGEGEK